MATITVEAKSPEVIVTVGQYKEQFAGPATYQKQNEEKGEGKAAVRRFLCLVLREQTAKSTWVYV